MTGNCKTSGDTPGGGAAADDAKRLAEIEAGIHEGFLDPGGHDRDYLLARVRRLEAEAAGLRRAANAATDEVERLRGFEEICRTLDRRFGCDHTSNGAEDARQLVRHVDELRESVAKLPKTADGVPIVPGMTVWWFAADRREWLEFWVHAVNDCSDPWATCDLRHGWDSYDPDPRQCYSTRDAALAASAGAGAGANNEGSK